MLDSKLETFLTAAKEQSFTRAAEKLHLTQPGVTQHIRKLERHYGVKLFDTSGHAVRLTSAGEWLYRYAQAQLCNEDRLCERLRGLRTPLRVGATLSVADYYLPPLLACYARQREETIYVEVGNTDTLIGRLADGTLDCAFIEGMFERDLYEAKVFCVAEFIPVIRADHPLAGKRARLAELCGLPLALREPGSGTRAVLESALFQQGFSIHSFARQMELGSFALVKAIVAATDSVSFLYERVAEAEMAAGKLVRIQMEDFAVQRPIYFIFQRDSMQQERNESFFNTLLSYESKTGDAL